MANTILIKTPNELVIDVFKPQQIITLAISNTQELATDTSSTTPVNFPVASYDRFGAVKVLENSGLTIEAGVLKPTDNYFVTVAQGAANAGKFLYVNSQGNVSLTQFSNMPTKTSDLENDGDGTSEFVTKQYMHNFLDSPEFYIPLAHIRLLFEEE